MKPFAYLVRVLRRSKGEKVEEITSLPLLSKKRRNDVDIPILDKDWDILEIRRRRTFFQW